MAYNVPFGVSVDESLTTAEELRDAMLALVGRHRMLNTVFKDRAMAAASGKHDIQIVHASSIGGKIDIKEWMLNECYKPFDLSEAVCRTRILVGANEASSIHLLFCAHHITVDLWSFNVMLRDLGAILDDREATLPSPGDYSSFVAEQFSADPKFDYWRDLLTAPIPVMQLPLDRPRPPQVTHKGSAVIFEVDEVSHLVVTAHLYGSSCASFSPLTSVSPS